MGFLFSGLSKTVSSETRAFDGGMGERGLLREVLYLWTIFMGLVTLFTLIMLLPAMAGPFQVFPKPTVAAGTGVIVKPGRTVRGQAVRQNTTTREQASAGQSGQNEGGVLVEVRKIDMTVLSDDAFGDEELTRGALEDLHRIYLKRP